MYMYIVLKGYVGPYGALSPSTISCQLVRGVSGALKRPGRGSRMTPLSSVNALNLLRTDLGGWCLSRSPAVANAEVIVPYGRRSANATAMGPWTRGQRCGYSPPLDDAQPTPTVYHSRVLAWGAALPLPPLAPLGPRLGTRASR